MDNREFWRLFALINGLIWLVLAAATGHSDDILIRPVYFAKAARHQSIHALLILWLTLQPLNVLRLWACRLLALGILLFSGTLYVLSYWPLNGGTWIVPIGGVSMVTAWLLLVIDATQMYRKEKRQK